MVRVGGFLTFIAIGSHQWLGEAFELYSSKFLHLYIPKHDPLVIQGLGDAFELNSSKFLY